MSGCSRLARRRGRIVATLSRPAQVGELLRSCRATWRIHPDGIGPAQVQVQSPSYGDKKLFRGTPSRLKKSPGLVSDWKALAKLPLPKPNVEYKLASESPQTLLGAGEGRQGLRPLEANLVVKEDFPILCRRLRRLPLRQLAMAVSPALSEAIRSRMPPEQAGPAVTRLWAAVSRRVLVNSAQLPLSCLAYALPHLQRLGHLTKVSALSKVVRGLARQASSQLQVPQEAHPALLPLLRCCKVLQLQLAVSKPRAAQIFAGRLHQALAKRLPAALERAPAALVVSWMEYYAEHGLVDHENVAVWEQAGKALNQCFLSSDEEARLFEIQERVPLWVSECLPPVSRPTSIVLSATQEPADLLDTALVESQQAESLTLAPWASSSASMQPPMYQRSPPVPVLWHISPENYQRRLSRLGPRQLVLALRYVAADGAGLLAGGSSDDPAAQRALQSLAGHWPRRHRSRSRAQQFVGALLEEFVERIPKLKPAEACSAVKSIASLRALVPSTASTALEALASGPLSGWKTATILRPCDVALLLQGLSGVVTDHGSSSDAVTEAARGLLRGGPAARLITLSACALQEAGAPPSGLRAMCAGTARLAAWQRIEGNGHLDAEMCRALRQFFTAAARAARDGPFLQPPELRLPLSVLRAAGDAGMWRSEVFSMLAPMVSTLVLGPAVKTRPPHHLRDWRPRLPRPSFVRSSWRPEELAEAAFLFSRSSGQLPLEGHAAAALSVTLLVHVSDLRSFLASWDGGAGHLLSPDEVDERVLLFAGHAVQILRHAATEPFFEPWKPPSRGPGFEPMPCTERFDPEVLEDERLSAQILWRWRKLMLATSERRRGAARRSADVAKADESADQERLLRSTLLAAGALAIFQGSAEGGTLGAGSMCVLLRALMSRLAPPCSPARGVIRSWLRKLRILRRRGQASVPLIQE